MNRTRIKICGITRLADGQAAADCGVDAIGLVFYAHSPRFVTVETAAKIIKELPPFVAVVALFVNPTCDEVKHIINNLAIDLLQFHGNESPEFCATCNFPYIKAIHIRPHIDLSQLAHNYTTARGLLVDTYNPVIPGGTGEVFNWDLLPKQRQFNLILAGGLNSNNVTAAIRCVQPYAVDVSGGVEIAKGIKDVKLIAAFIQAVQKAQYEL